MEPSTSTASSNPFFNNAVLKKLKQLKSLIILNVILSVILVGVIAWWYFVCCDTKRGTEKKLAGHVEQMDILRFDRGVPDTIAMVAIENFDSEMKKIGFDTARTHFGIARINNYFNTILPAILQRHSEKQVAEGTTSIMDTYEWKLAIYPMVAKNASPAGDQQAISIYVLPVLVNKTNGKMVLDYFNPANNIYYAHPGSLSRSDTDTTDDNVYNEGQLWP